VNVIGISGLDNSVAFKRRELPDLDQREYRIAQGFDSAAALVTDDDVAAARGWPTRRPLPRRSRC